MVNPSAEEALPGLVPEDPEKNLTCRDMRKVLWALNKAPEMAYMLKSYSSECEFMARLNCDADTLRIVRVKDGYRLHEDIQNSWCRLEEMFVAITGSLMDSQRHNPEVVYSWDAHWTLPNACGYLQTHRSAAAARSAAMRSRDACVLLLARCSMAIALCASVTDMDPGWIAVLQGQVPASWIDIVRKSVVSRMAPGLRTGAFIDLTGKTLWVHHVPCMIRAHLPVYICWNAPIKDVLEKYPFLIHFVPPASGIPVVSEEMYGRLRFRWPVEPVDISSLKLPWRIKNTAGDMSKSIAAISSLEEGISEGREMCT